MSYSAKIICDSISETGKRLTTFETTFPRIVLAEFNTHRMFSRNSASSRAIPLEKQINRIRNAGFIPEVFPVNCKGMQPQELITKDNPEYERHLSRWLWKRERAILDAYEEAEQFNWHKQLIARPLEAYMMHTVIVTATEFDNFFKLRTDENAQYEIRRIADLMYEAYHWQDKIGEELRNPELWGTVIKPIQKLKVGEWHLPFVSDEDEIQITNYIESGKDMDLYHDWFSGNTSDQHATILYCKKKVSVARCARVSYLTHDGKRDIEKDLELFERLRISGHWSPFEHVATPFFTKDYEDCPKDGFDLAGDGKSIDLRSGNFSGWQQMRKEFQDENCTYFRK